MRPNTQPSSPAARVPPLSASELLELDAALSSRARRLRVHIREDLQRRHSASADAMTEQVRRQDTASLRQACGRRLSLCGAYRQCHRK